MLESCNKTVVLACDGTVRRPGRCDSAVPLGNGFSLRSPCIAVADIGSKAVSASAAGAAATGAGATAAAAPAVPVYRGGSW